MLMAPFAAAQQATLSHLDIAHLEIVTSSVISSSGNHIAYLVAVPADPLEANAPSQQHLYVVDLNTRETTGLHTQSSVSGLAIRPEHSTVTFIASIEEGERRSIYEVPIWGGTPQRVVSHSANILTYSWNHDGSAVVFQAFEEVTPPSTPAAYMPTLYEENLPQRRAFIQEIGGEAVEIAPEGSVYITSWSKDGSKIAIGIAPTPHVDDMYMWQEVKVLDASNGEVVAEIDNEGKIADIVWSPDGQHLALLAAHDMNDPIEGRIMVVSAEGGKPQNIFPGFLGKFEQIRWDSGNTIYFVASESTARSFGTISYTGDGFTRRALEDDVIFGGFSRSDNGTTAFVANTPHHPSEVYILGTNSDSFERVTNHNPVLDTIAFGEQRVVTYTARDEEFDIDGILILPVGYNPNQRYPLITIVHGGPEAHYSNGWLTGYSMQGQLAAGAGYAVFYPNYRGSTGRGLEFIYSSQADLAGKEFDDIVDGVDYLIEIGIADPDRIGVTGGSYGGYATAWMSTRYSERFAAGVMFVGISNNLSKWGTSDIPDELYYVHSRQRMWQSDAYWMNYLQRSPIYHVDNAQTPLLIMHGAEDTRVHPAQSLELYRHIKVRRPDVPVRLVLYPGEGHGNVRSGSRLDYSLRAMDWFNAFLKGDGTPPPLDIALPE